MKTKTFTILHSNDMHGDFLAEAKGAGGKLIGGLALLSGYINRVRQEEENVLYVIAGDMLQGSVIDEEYKGVSTIEIMNYLAPDVVTLGNHEFEYGLPHLLFLERMANFPIVNANLYIRKYNKRLMRPYHIINKAGFDILLVGVITDEVLKTLKKDSEIASFISLEDAAQEVAKICNAYRDEDIDLTVLLTHIGFEADKELAQLLDPDCGVDLIIGGHSHTILEQPALVNGALIAQAGVGTDQIGRFDIVVDDDTNRVVEWKWQLIPIDGSLAGPDEELRKFIDSFKEAVDHKYNTIISRLVRRLSHPGLAEETELGNLFADIFAQRVQAQVMLFASFAIRGTGLGPVITLEDFRTHFPYDDKLLKLTVNGVRLKQLFRHILRPAVRSGDGYFFQINRGVRAIYDDKLKELVELAIDGQPVHDSGQYTVCLQQYHYDDTLIHFGVLREDLAELGEPQIVTTSMRDILEEHLRNHQNLNSAVEERLQFKS